MRKDYMIKKGIDSGLILPFDKEIFSMLDNTFVCGIPVSMHLKFFNSVSGIGNFHDKSLYMFFSIPNSILVYCKCNYKGHEYIDHGFVETDKYVYDPATLMRFDKELYYLIYDPTDVTKCTLDEYCSDDENKKIYEYITKYCLEDYMPDGCERKEFLYNAKNVEYYRNIKEVDDYLNMLDYDSSSVINDINERIDVLVKNKR